MEKRPIPWVPGATNRPWDHKASTPHQSPPSSLPRGSTHQSLTPGGTWGVAVEERGSLESDCFQCSLCGFGQGSSQRPAWRVAVHRGTGRGAAWTQVCPEGWATEAWGGGGQLTLSWLAGQLSAGAGLLWGQGQSSREGVGRERREPFWMDGCLDGRQAPRASCTPPSSGEPEGRGHNPPGLPAPTLAAGLPQAVAAREKCHCKIVNQQST